MYLLQAGNLSDTLDLRPLSWAPLDFSLFCFIGASIRLATLGGDSPANGADSDPFSSLACAADVWTNTFPFSGGFLSLLGCMRTERKP